MLNDLQEVTSEETLDQWAARVAAEDSAKPVVEPEVPQEETLEEWANKVATPEVPPPVTPTEPSEVFPAKRPPEAPRYRVGDVKKAIPSLVMPEKLAPEYGTYTEEEKWRRLSEREKRDVPRISPAYEDESLAPERARAEYEFEQKISGEEETPWWLQIIPKGPRGIAEAAIDKVRGTERPEPLPYERFEDITEPITEIATQYINAHFAGAPELLQRVLGGGELPPPETIPGQLAHLAGFIRGPAKYAGKLMTEALSIPAKTIPGAAMQNVLHQMGTIGMASAVSEWKGDTVDEVMYNKLEALKGGAMVGATFGGAQFAKFAKENPLVGQIVRLGMVEVAQDFTSGRWKEPYDARTVMDRIYDTGLNVWFTRPGAAVTPKQLFETKRFNAAMREEGLPEMEMPKVVPEAEFEAAEVKREAGTKAMREKQAGEGYKPLHPEEFPIAEEARKARLGEVQKKTTAPKAPEAEVETEGTISQRVFDLGKRVEKEVETKSWAEKAFRQELSNKEIGEMSKKEKDTYGRLTDHLNNVPGKTRRPNVIRNSFKKLGIEVPDDIMQRAEQVYADTRADKHTGDIKRLKDSLKKYGVREQIIDETLVEGRHPLGNLIKIRRSKVTGEVNSYITESGLKFAKDTFDKSARTPDVLRKWKQKLQYGSKQFFQGLEVPQQYFKRIGWKWMYDTVRVGERKTEILKREMEDEVLGASKDLHPYERKELGLFFAGKQGMEKEMADVGQKPITWKQLNPGQRSFVRWWRGFNKRYAPQIKALAEKHNKPVEFIENYFPMYVKKQVKHISGTYIDNVSGDPWFGSLQKRQEGVLFSDRELDVFKNAMGFIKGASNYLELGKRTFPLKHFLGAKNNPELKALMGNDTHAMVSEWLDNVISGPPRGKKGTEIARWGVSKLRKAGYRSYMGLNPITMMKQAISYLDTIMFENIAVGSPRVRKVIKQLGKPASVEERLPEIGMMDMNSKVDRALLGHIMTADQFFAKGAFSNVLAAELETIFKQDGKLTNKSLRKAVHAVSDRIDLSMGGMSAAQKPPFFRSEEGKTILMFTSTINSRFQYYLENMMGPKTALRGTEARTAAKDVEAVAKVLTLFFMGGYVEQSMSKLSPTWGDAEEMIGDILRGAGGNIATLGTMIYASQSGDYNISPVYKNISDAWEAFTKYQRGQAGVEEPLSRIAEVAGVPKQIRKIFEGAKVLKEGKRVGKGKYVKVDNAMEGIRALVKGQTPDADWILYCVKCGWKDIRPKGYKVNKPCHNCGSYERTESDPSINPNAPDADMDELVEELIRCVFDNQDEQNVAHVRNMIIRVLKGANTQCTPEQVEFGTQELRECAYAIYKRRSDGYRSFMDSTVALLQHLHSKPEQKEKDAIERDTYREILSLNAIYNTLTDCQKCDLKADYEYLRQVLSMMQRKPVAKVEE